MVAKNSALDVINRYRNTPAYGKNVVYIGGKTVAALDIEEREIKTLAQEIDTFVDWDSAPRIAAMVVRAAPRILDAVRMVNEHTRSGYGGAAGRGNQLIAQPMQLFDILRYNPSSTAVGTYPMTTWLRQPTSTGASAWSGTSTYTNPMIVSSLPYLSHVYVGFIDAVEVPKVNKIQIIKDGDPYPVENPNFEWRGTFGDNMVPTHELLQPWIIPPTSAYYIAVNYYAVGDDKLQPIAFTVKRATDVLSAIA